jgi:peptide/nickel transport system substrate-binding protein
MLRSCLITRSSALSTHRSALASEEETTMARLLNRHSETAFKMQRMLLVGLLSLVLSSGAAMAQTGRGGALRIGMTAADIAYTAGQPDQGFEGFRFVGYPLYDALVRWDLSQGERLPDIVPGLAESWEVDKNEALRWRFKLRRGVKFHDGSDFNADAVVWNWDKIRNKDAPQYDPKQAGEIAFRITVIKDYRKIDDSTIEFTTTRPSSFVPFQVVYVLYSSPTQWEKVGRNWGAFAQNPSGTGPFKMTRFLPRERAEYEPNPEYWDKNRIPKSDKVILLPMPEVTTRLAALRTGQVDWIEVPPPDAIPVLRQSGFQIFSRSYPHVWPYSLNLKISPWNNKLVRQAANYAIDREGICKSLLNDTCTAATGVVYTGHPWFGSPKQTYTYDPQKAKDLMKQAGYDGKRAKTSFLISTSGSGQMLPLPMNEYVQENLREVGIDVELIPIEWNALTALLRKGFVDDQAQTGAMNVSYNFVEPFSAFVRFFHSASVPPRSLNVMNFTNPEADRLIEAAEASFDPKARDETLGRLHELVMDEAPWIFVVHDLNPRAMSPKVKGFVQPQSWFVDLALPWVEK